MDLIWEHRICLKLHHGQIKTQFKKKKTETIYCMKHFAQWVCYVNNALNNLAFDLGMQTCKCDQHDFVD